MVLTLLTALLLTCCGDNREGEEKPMRFTEQLRLKTTPVKDQGQSSLCWIYAMLATMETEHAMMGDSVNLSADYAAANMLMERTIDRYFDNHAEEAPVPERPRKPIEQRGMMTMTPDLVRRNGLVAYDAYHTRQPVNYNALCRKLALTCRPKRGISHLKRRAGSILEQTLGYRPEHVFMLGARYTPEEFAHSVCRKNEYMALTSYTHHPFGQPMTLECPDNFQHDRFLNLPIDTLMKTVEQAIENGHAVCWEGDISEPGFRWKEGVATLPPLKPGDNGQHLRQQMFERLQTTDDHCMALIGTATDQTGKRYFIAKNSWGTDNALDGYIYLSEDYVRLKTIAVMLSRDWKKTNRKRIKTITEKENGND